MQKILVIILSLLLSVTADAATLRFSADGMTYRWEETDMMGFITEKGLQIRFGVSTVSVDGHSAVTTGNGWSLKEDVTYYAYAPYRSKYSVNEEHADALPMDFSLQVQTGNDNTDHLMAHAFYVGDVHVGKSSAVNVSLSPMTSVLRISERFSQSLSFKEIEVTVGEYIIPLMGNFNLIDKSFEPTGSSGRIALQLKDVQVQANEDAVFYLTLPPCNLVGEEIEITFVTSDGTRYRRTLDGFNVLPGKTYCIGAELAPTSLQGYTLIAGGTKDTPVVMADDLPIEGSFIATKVDNNLTPMPNVKVYDLTGREVKEGYRGIKIINGKKVYTR